MGTLLKKAPRFLSHLYLIIVILIGWVFFRAENITLAFFYLKGMFAFNFQQVGFIYTYLNNHFVLIMVLGLILSTPIIPEIGKYLVNIKGLNLSVAQNLYIYEIFTFTVFVISIVYMSGFDNNPFIYFRF